MMATVVNQTPPTRYARIPTWLRDLVFVTDFFSWLFALCSRLAEPLMLLCTLYIVAEAGVPAIAQPVMHNLAIGMMICAPEIILPGSFVVAARAQEHARLLFAVCWTFVGLTLLTLISLFVWHFTGAALAWLMCARCAAAVSYSILMRVMAHGQLDPQKGSRPDVLTTLTEHLQDIETNMKLTVAAQLQDSQERMLGELAERMEQRMHLLDLRQQTTLTTIKEESEATRKSLTPDRLIASLTGPIETLLQERVKVSLAEMRQISTSKVSPETSNIRLLTPQKVSRHSVRQEGETASNGTNIARIYALLNEDRSRKAAEIQRLTGIPKATVYRLVERYHNENPVIEAGAINETKTEDEIGSETETA